MRMAVASFLIFSLLYTTVHSTRCYSSKGDPFVYTDEEPIEAWMPCDLTAEVSNCCSPRDYCMSNGLVSMLLSAFCVVLFGALAFPVCRDTCIYLMSHDTKSGYNVRLILTNPLSV